MSETAATIVVDGTPGVAEEARRRPGRQAGLILLGILIVIGMLAYGFHWWAIGRFIETTDDAYIGGNVTVIAPHISGYVAQILVADNQHVRAGQLLVRLEVHDFQAMQEAASAGVAERKASLTRLHAQHALEQDMIYKAAADLAAKKASAEFATLNARRYRSLAASQAGSQQSAERARASARAARADVASAEAGVQAARQQLVVIDARIVEAQAALAQARATQRGADLDLGYTELRSPIDGYVGDRSAHPGTYVMAGTQLMSIVPSHGLWVNANFKEDQILNMKPGQPVDIVADAMPSRTFHGHVKSLSPATGAVFSVIPPQNATGNFTKIVQRIPVRIALDQDASVLGALRVGLSATVSVNTHASASVGNSQ